MKNRTFKFTVLDIAEIGVMVALAIVLDTFVKIPLGSTGGSINFSALPLFAIALRKGWFKGLLSSAIVYGLITCLIDGYGFACYPLEYFVAFGTTAVLGVFRNPIIRLFKGNAASKTSAIAIVVACVVLWGVVRMCVASVDSVILWEYPWADAFAYNAVYCLPSMAIDAVLMGALLPAFVALENRKKSITE